MSKVIGGAFGGGGSPPPASAPVIAPDTIRSHGVIEVVEAWAWGEIQAFPDGADPLEYIKLDGTPIKANGNLNFQGVTFDYRKGTQDQTYIQGTIGDAIGNPVSVNVPVLHDTPVIRTISNPNADAVRVIITYQGVYKIDLTTGNHNGAVVELDIAVRPAGYSLFQLVDLKGRGRIYDKTESPYQRAFTINLRNFDQNVDSYDIRVRRVSPDPESSEITAFNWDSYVELTHVKLRRPNIAHCRFAFDTRYFSSPPVRSYDLLGWLVQVPPSTVYDPVNRTYTGADWDGTLVKRYCNCPAWVFYHVLTTAGVGLGQEINPAYQDKWKIFEIAKRCDRFVPDGVGGLEHLYSIDVQIMSQVPADEMIKQLSGVFDAQALWNGSSIYLTQDAPKPVSSIYVPANVVGGRFAFAGTGRQVRYTAALIYYNDITDASRLTPEYVEDLTGIERYGYRLKTETMLGCISRAEAHRRGKRLLVSAREEIDSVVFSVGMSGISDNVGDIIRIAAPLRSGGQRQGGRLSDGCTITQLQLDAPVTLASGSSYRISIVGNDGNLLDVAVTNAAGTHQTINVSPALPAAPEQELEWLVYAPAAIAQTFRILSITENDDKSSGFYSISCTQYAESKYSQIEDLADLPVTPPNPFITNGVIPPSGLQATEGVYTGLEGLTRYIDLSWTASNDPLLRGYFLSYRHNGATLLAREVSGQSWRIDNIKEGTYEITLSAVNAVGRYSSSITISHVVGVLYLISAVSITDLALASGTNEFVGRNAFFSWSTNAASVLGSFATAPGGQSPWFRDFEVRIYSDADVLLRTEYLTENFYTYSFEKNVEDGGPRRSFYINVRARDYYGNYSNNASHNAVNPPSVDFGAVTYTPGQGIIFLKYTKPTDPDYRYTRIYASLTTGFTPGPTNLVGETTDRVTSFPAEAGTWYVRLEGVDEFGPASVFSTETAVIVDVGSDIEAQVNAILEDPGRIGDVVVEATRFLIVSPSTTAPLTAVFGVGTINGVAKVGVKGDVVIDGSLHGRSITAASIAADRLSVNQLSAVSADMGLVTAGTFRTAPGTGYRVEMSDVGSFPIWYGTGTKNATNGLFYVDTAGNAVFKGTLSGVDGTFSGTLSAATGTFSGTLSAATGTFSGTLSAATGTFQGLLSGGSINLGSGTFTVSSAGAVDARSIVIRKPDGTVILSANSFDGTIINQLSVDSLSIKNNAITVPLGVVTAASLVISNSQAQTTIQTLTTGVLSTVLTTRLMITFGFYYANNTVGTTVRLSSQLGVHYSNNIAASVSTGSNGSFSASIIVNLAVNSSLTFTLSVQNSLSTGGSSANNRFITCMATKK